MLVWYIRSWVEHISHKLRETYGDLIEEGHFHGIHAKEDREMVRQGEVCFGLRPKVWVRLSLSRLRLQGVCCFVFFKESLKHVLG